MPHPSKAFAVVLQQNAPTVLLEWLVAYLSERNGTKYLLCDAVLATHWSLELTAIGEPGPWRLQIPLHYVLFVADISDPARFGFV